MGCVKVCVYVCVNDGVTSWKWVENVGNDVTCAGDMVIAAQLIGRGRREVAR